MDNFSSYFSLKPYVVIPHLNRLNDTVQMWDYVCFYAEGQKIISNYYQIPPLSRALDFFLSPCFFIGHPG